VCAATRRRARAGGRQPSRGAVRVSAPLLMLCSDAEGVL
jgi:hypothetical protein